MTIQWPLVLFSVFAGCGGGLLMCVGLSAFLDFAEKSRKIAAVIALALLIVGGCCSVFHLGQPTNIMAAAAHIFAFSSISIELIALGIGVIAAIVYLASEKSESTALKKFFAICLIVIGVILSFALGNSYALEARPAWNTMLLPLGYMFSGLAMGSTVFFALENIKKEQSGKGSVLFLKLAISIIILQTIVYIGYGIFIQFIGNMLLFWGGAVIFGCAIPLACLLVARKKSAMSYGAAAGCVIGGIAFRAFMWLVGTAYFGAFTIAGMHMTLGI